VNRRCSAFSYPESREYQNALKRYISDVGTAENEAAKAARFFMFLPQIYKGIKPEYADRVFEELKIEKPVLDKIKSKGKTVIVRGRIDSLLGNVIFEFEKDLSKTIEEALDQLREYTAALWNGTKYSRTAYTCIATDGLRFCPYRPHTDVPEGQHVGESDVFLETREVVDLRNMDPVDAYFWFDRYLLATPILEPTVDLITEEFGSRSPILPEMIQELKELWKNASELPSVRVLFDQWNKYLTIVYGSAVGDEELFLRHTYLATLAKLIVYGYFSEGALPTTEEEILRTLNGEAFKDWKIRNFLEEDFFTWVIRGKVRVQGVKFARKLIKSVARFDLDKIDQDMLREVYQELVDPETRKSLGEFYTPEWLTELLLEPVVSKGPDKSYLDPACGSGTFLFTTIRLKKKYQTGLRGHTLLQSIVETVQGIDVHPLAVIVSKANYLLALGKLLRSANRASISVPVYLSNSIKPPEHEMDPSSTLPTYRFDAYGHLLKIPEAIAENPAIMDGVVDTISEYAVGLTKEEGQFENTLNFFAKLIQKRVPDLERIDSTNLPSTINTLFETAKIMVSLIEEEKDTIWAFIIKNYYKPLFLRELKFDFVIGNPPWLTYKGISDPIYQNFVKDQIVNVYGLTRGEKSRTAELITHMEQATLFMLRCAEFYLRDGGKILFVMPRSVLTADHHDAFRRNTYSQRVKLKFERVYDLEKIEPLFGMPACAIVATKSDRTTYPIPCVRLTGRMESKNVGWAIASKQLSESKFKLALSILGSRSALAPEDHAIKYTGAPSPYFERFHQGASIVPRSLFFVEFEKGGRFGVTSDAPKIRSSKRAMDRAKKDYREVELEGAVEREYLYAALTGSELVPFGHLPHLTVVLPIRQVNGKLAVVTAAEAKSQMVEGFYKWFSEAERLWKKIRGKKSDYNLYQWVDHMGKLTNQNIRAKYRVVFPGPSATYLVSSVIPYRKYSTKVEDRTISLQGLILDHALLVYETENEDEAYYLSAMLNSATIDRIIKPFQSTGKGGAQNIHKKPLELPIPMYTPRNTKHRELVTLGKQCYEMVSSVLPEIASRYDGVAGIRREVKDRVAAQLSRIDALSKDILFEQTSNTLERHM
jgi:hypothetical protein